MDKKLIRRNRFFVFIAIQSYFPVIIDREKVSFQENSTRVTRMTLYSVWQDLPSIRRIYAAFATTWRACLAGSRPREILVTIADPFQSFRLLRYRGRVFSRDVSSTLIRTHSDVVDHSRRGSSHAL